MCKQLSRSILFSFRCASSCLGCFCLCFTVSELFFCKHKKKFLNSNCLGSFTTKCFFSIFGILFVMFIQFIRVNKTPFMYIDRILPFTTFISRNKHNKNKWLRLRWLKAEVAEAETETSHITSTMLYIYTRWTTFS